MAKIHFSPLAQSTTLQNVSSSYISTSFTTTST